MCKSDNFAIGKTFTCYCFTSILIFLLIYTGWSAKFLFHFEGTFQAFAGVFQQLQDININI